MIHTHDNRRGLALAVCDAALGEIIGRKLDSHAVARHDADEVLSHPTGNVSHHFGAGLKLDTEPRVGECLGDGAFDFEGFFFLSQNGSSLIYGIAAARQVTS